MPPNRPKRVVHDIAFDLPRQHCFRIPNVDKLVILEQELLYDYRVGPPDYNRLYEETIETIKKYPYEKLLQGIADRDGPVMLELVMRSLVRCAVPEVTMSYDDIFSVLESLTGLDMGRIASKYGGRRPQICNSTPLLRRRALAVCAWMYFNNHFNLPGWGSLYYLMKNTSMPNAAAAADTCARDGFQPYIVIRIAQWLMTVEARYLVNVRTVDHYSDFKKLWSAYDEYCQRSTQKDVQLRARLASHPLAYRCAADGCGVQAVHRGAFRACGGNCTRESKPHYCSTQCQEKHWFVHRYVCKKGISGDPISPDDNDPDWVIVPDSYSTNYWEDFAGSMLPKAWNRHENAEIFIDIPHPGHFRKGEVFRIRTRTLSPMMLRLTRWYSCNDWPTGVVDDESWVKRSNVPAVKPRQVRTGGTKARMTWRS